MCLHSRSALAVGLFLSAVAFGQQAPPDANSANGLSAREVFYEAVQFAAQAPQPTAPKAAESSAPRPVTHKEKKPAKAPSSVASIHPPQQITPSEPADNPRGQPSGPTLTNASLTSTHYPPLGLRYSVYQVVDGQRVPVSADSVFHSNDHIQFVVQVNSPVYLYVISRGSSGRWTTLFPDSDSAANANLIQPMHPYVYPSDGVITFADPAGKEELFLFASRKPIASAEDLMLQISGANAPAATSQPKAPDNGQHPSVIEAFNHMDDAQFQALETSYSRDLIVEKVNSGPATAADAPAPAAQSTPQSPPVQDNSVYVVNPSHSADSHVVATVAFHHE